ncbi:hypothetical protein [Tumebacillus flagellatus]|uniref:Uncharacterized protein n=1 Tax=Tumebacillus flagellatus TaxID=1157490 RepID=A0A074LUN9_9BACL|nr:hypothetical protein [Tumebacillus flagellatus]KEO83613.1 hypothetical protein EL26_09380 [Tumebacillus flagellatus]
MENQELHEGELHGEVGAHLDELCQSIWNYYEDHPDSKPVEVTINNVGTGILAKKDEDGLFFEANGDEFDIEEFFMENNLESDTVSFHKKQ